MGPLLLFWMHYDDFDKRGSFRENRDKISKSLSLSNEKTVARADIFLETHTPHSQLFYAPPTPKISNQLIEDLKRIYELKPFIAVEPMESK